MSRIKQASPALAISIVALVASLVVPAIAQVATTALSKKEKKVVKKVARVQANKRITKRAPNLNVNSAKTATSAGTASDADKLDGQDAIDFTPADEVYSPARFLRNDTVPGNATGQLSTLLVAGPFTVQALCGDDINGSGVDNAAVRLLAPNGSSYAGMRSDGTFVNETGSSQEEIASANSNNPQTRGGHLIVSATNGQVLSVSASVEVGDSAADCVFAVTAISRP